jgi:hypothetical protein
VVPPRLRSNRERHSCAVTGLPGDDYLFHHPGLSSEKAGEFGLCIPVDTVKGSHVRSLLADGMTYYSCHDLDYILVDPEGFEPSTFSMPLRRAPNCAMGPVHDLFYTSSGPEGIRTPDLLSAIETRSQLRYRPKFKVQGILPEAYRHVKETVYDAPESG